MRSTLLFGLATIAIFASCNQNNLKYPDVWVPVYKDKAAAQAIENLAPQAVARGGKIYTYGSYIFQVEENQGIHIFQLQNENPIPVGFIRVYGAQEISIKDDMLYTNNFNDIVVLNISNPTQAVLTTRMPNQFKLNNFEIPPTSGHFQCADSTKGYVVGWELQHNVEAKCIY